MLVWIRVFVIGVLGAVVPHSGHSQDIIYDGNSAPNGSNISSQTQTQSIEQPRFPETQSPITTDMPSFVSETARQPELNLFDLTATIPEDGTDSQTPLLEIDETDLTANSAPLQNGSLLGDNTSDLDTLISELFPTEEVLLDTQLNDQLDNGSQQAVSAILPNEQTPEEQISEEQALPEDQVLKDTGFATPAVSVGLRNLSGVGLVTTGIADWQQREMPFSTLLWSGSKPHHIHYLYEMSEPYGASKTINALVYSAIIRKSAPPIGVAGNSELAHSLVVDRIEWLARAGHSDALADLIRKLPEDDQSWDEWQRWLGAYDLLSYNDAVTCSKADKKVSQDFDAFWLKVQIVCKIIDGAYEDALFLAELMSTSGEEDPLFFALLENFHSAQSSNLELGQSSLTPLHLSLMDLAEAPIEWHQVSELPSSMMQASNLIKNTTREARLAFAMKQILQQSESAFEASALIRSLYDAERPIETAFSILQNTNGELRLIASAEIYAALAGSMFQAEVQQDYDLLFLSAFKEEVKFGNGPALLPFYADLAKTRLTADGLPLIAPELKPQFEKMVLLHELTNTPAQDTGISSQDTSISSMEMDKLFLLMNASMADKPSIDVLKEFDLAHLLPVFDQALMIQTPLSWIELASTNVEKPNASESLELEPVLRNALIEASKNRRTAETILIISAMFEKYKLIHISANDLALVVRSLQEIGFDGSVDDLIKEIVTAHLIEKYWQEEI
ncbi:MAG: hypothetical protein DBW68_00455 [SAR116 cluster bacterium]|jgi:hypothetical protein|nr:MAG: hypothetical protein DBW68_00455 [SAR116 cluster bacterium]